MSELMVGTRSGVRWNPFADIEKCHGGHCDAMDSQRILAESLLTRCHGPDLARSHTVRPYVRPAPDRGPLWIGCISGHRSDIRLLRKKICDVLDSYPVLSTGRSPSKSVPCAMAAISTRVAESRMNGFVDRGTTLGQFYSDCSRSGLWNKEFRH